MKNETFTPERIKAEADAFFEWDGEDRSLVTTTSCLLFAQHIAGLMQARAAQGQQVECQECGRLRGDFEELAERYGKLQAGEDSLLVKVVTERDHLRAELAALKAQQVGQEPAGEVHLRTGGGISLLHVELAQSLPPGTKLYTAPQPAPAQDVAGWISVAERLPSCGQAVLAYYLNRQGMGRRIRAEYVTRWTVEAEMFADPDTECVEYSEQDDTYYVTEGWYELIDNWDEYARIAVNEGVVTRWMPLPAAPAAHDKQSGGE